MERWTTQEIEKLKLFFPRTTNKELVGLFKNRSFRSLYKKAYDLGLKRNNEIEFINRSTGREWTHNRRKTRKGYVTLYKPEHPRADRNGRVFEHIVIYEDYYKTSVSEEFVIHHINGIKDDNRIENLKMMTFGEHSAYHNKKRRKEKI